MYMYVLWREQAFSLKQISRNLLSLLSSLAGHEIVMIAFDFYFV